MSEVSRQLLEKYSLTDQSMRTMLRNFIMKAILSYISANQIEVVVQSCNRVIWLMSFYLRFLLLANFASKHTLPLVDS